MTSLDQPGVFLDMDGRHFLLRIGPLKLSRLNDESLCKIWSACYEFWKFIYKCHLTARSVFKGSTVVHCSKVWSAKFLGRKGRIIVCWAFVLEYQLMNKLAFSAVISLCWCFNFSPFFQYCTPWFTGSDWLCSITYVSFKWNLVLICVESKWNFLFLCKRCTLCHKNSCKE